MAGVAFSFYLQFAKLFSMESLKKNIKWYLLAALFLTNLFIWHAIFSESRNGILTVAFLDVGQGDAILTV